LGEERLAKSLATSGLRFTRQRQQVFDVVSESHDHPTAEDIFQRSKSSMPDISFATVYNCLDVLVGCGLVRQVTLDRSPTRFCPNMREHCHFYCEVCRQVIDIDVPHPTKVPLDLPAGFRITHFDMALHGVCPECSK
jgi:Fur family peroxide stress response transcriptional regulator